MVQGNYYLLNVNMIFSCSVSLPVMMARALFGI